MQLRDVQQFLEKNYDLHVTVSTISRQLSRAGHARARRPGYKNTRPDLQAEAQAQQQLPVATVVTSAQEMQRPVDGQAQGAEAADANGQAPPPAFYSKLACPFFKLDPQRYMDMPFCQSTWHTARDVKFVFARHIHLPSS